jgi:hypothetical protein
MQLVVFASSGGFTPVAPMLFTSQLTLPFPRDWLLREMFPAISSD